MTQTINSIVMEIIQENIHFKAKRDDEEEQHSIISNEKIRGLLVLKLKYLDYAMEQMVKKVLESIKNFFASMEQKLLILFGAFVLVMIVGTSLSATLGMDFLFKHFNATKSILNLIPGKCLLELSEKTDLKKIHSPN